MHGSWHLWRSHPSQLLWQWVIWWSNLNYPDSVSLNLLVTYMFSPEGVQIYQHIIFPNYCFLINLAPPMWGEVLVLIVCVCVCYCSSGCSGYLMSQNKVSTESARCNEQNQLRDLLKMLLQKLRQFWAHHEDFVLMLQNRNQWAVALLLAGH